MDINFCNKLESIRKPRVYNKGQFVFCQDERASMFYYLKSGLIQGIVTLANGEECKVMTTWPGTFFAVSDFQLETPRKLSAMVIKKSEIIVIDKQIYQTCQDNIPEFDNTLLQTLSKDINILFEKLYIYQLLDSRISVARFICRRIKERLYKENCSFISLSYTQDFIASTLGISRWTVNQILNDFKNLGWININYGAIIVYNYEAIKECAYADITED